MKKIISIIILIMVMFACFGCGGGGHNSSKGQINLYGTSPTVSGSSLKAMATEEIPLESYYWISIPNSSGGLTRGISAYYYVDGVKQNVPVSLVKDFSGTNEVDSYKITYSGNYSDGGSSIAITGQKHGKARLVASCEGVTKEIIINCFDSFYFLTLPIGQGVAINQNGHIDSTVKEECALFNDGSGIKLVSGRAYEITLDSSLSQGDQLANIKTIDVSKFTSYTATFSLMGDTKLLVCEVPGGYIKLLVWGGYGYVFEFSSTGTFN